MKKRIFAMFILAASMAMVACSSSSTVNEGATSGELVLYSDNKLAKGWVDTDTNAGNAIVKSKSIEYEKGLPTGNFKIYDENGLIVIETKLKNKGAGIFQGQMITSEDGMLKKATGEFLIDTDYLIDGISFEDTDLLFRTIVNGDIETKYKDGQIQYKGKYKNSRRIGEHVSYYGNGNLEAKGEYREDGSADRVEYHMNGNLALKESFSDYYNYVHTGIYERYYENGQLDVREKYLENGSSIYEEFYPNGRPSLKCNYVNYEDEKLLDGEYTEYYENGNLKANAYYNQNVLEKFVINYSNGVLGFSGDRIKFNAKVYSKNGELLMSFVNGQLYYLNNILVYDPYAYKEEQLEVERILENLPYSNYVAKE